MIMENILGIFYLVAGLIVAIWIWCKDYKYDYELAKSQNDVEDGMAVIFMMMLFFFWPLFLVHKLFKKIF